MFISMKKLKIVVVMLLLSVFYINANAKLYIIVNKNSPITSISRSTLKRIYLGKFVHISGTNKSFYPIDLSSRSSARSEFVRKVIRMKPSLLMQYRSRLIFSGKGRVPISIGSQSRVQAIVSRKSNAIAYVSSAPNSSKVKTVLVL